MRFCSRLAPNPYLRVMRQGWSVMSGVTSSAAALIDLVSVDAHVGGVGVGEQANDAGLVRNQAVAEFVFEIFRVDLPGLPDEIDSVGDFRHESFGEAESPVAVFEVGGEADGVAAGVGGVVPGAVVVGGPVDELEVSVGADGVDVEEIRHAEFAEAEFETAAREFVEEGEESCAGFRLCRRSGRRLCGTCRDRDTEPCLANGLRTMSRSVLPASPKPWLSAAPPASSMSTRNSVELLRRTPV